MNCPACSNELTTVDYEGVKVETCKSCQGEWLDSDELGKIVKLREVKFDEDTRRAIAAAAGIKGVKLETVDRDLACPKCEGTTDALNYGGDTGIILDRCTSCKGMWLDADELEKIQQLVEGWEDLLPEDLKKYGPVLREAAVKADKADDCLLYTSPAHET